MKNFLYVLVFFSAILMVFSGCSDSGNIVRDIQVAFSALTADGSPTETTRNITLTFSRNITDLNVDDITLAGSNADLIEKTALTQTDPGVYVLSLRGITASENLTVMVTKRRYIIEPPSKDVGVYYFFSPNITFESLAHNGISDTAPDMVTLTFSDDIPGLGAGDLVVSGPGTGVTKGSISRTGVGRYTLGIDGITVSGNLHVTVEKDGLNIQPPTRSVPVYISYWDDTNHDIPAGERAFIDFSAFTGTSPITTNQPSSATAGSFTLANGITGDGLRVSHLGDGSVPVYFEQHGCAMAARTSNFLYFFIDKPAVKSASSVVLAVTFFDDAPGSFVVHYVGTGGSNPNYVGVTITKNGSGTYVTTQIQLDNCNFNGGTQNQGAQFRFNFGVGPVQRVELIAGSLPEAVISDPPPFAPPTDLNNMIGKMVTGYQAWFNTGSWHHWRLNSTSARPGPGNVSVEMWPAGLEDYIANGAVLYDTDFTMPDGSNGRVFNSRDAPIIRTHQQWMREAGIDGLAVQRFFDYTSTAYTGNMPSYLTSIRDAAEETGRIFYIMYDMTAAGQSNQDTLLRRIQLDWLYNVEYKGLVSSPNYAQAEGRPVVCIWGIHAIESQDNYRYATVDVTIELIQWFRNRGYYVIGGVPDDEFWRTDGGRHARGREMYSSVDMISPWYIGRNVPNRVLGGVNLLTNGMNFCRTTQRSWADNQPIAFMPTLWPGFAWTNMGNVGSPNREARDAGQWIWTLVQGFFSRDTHNQIHNIYLAMFDEYDEATAWMKAGRDYFDIPINQYFLTLAADGTWLSSDYYLRVAKTIGTILKNRGPGAVNIGPLNQYDNGSSSIVPHSLGPVFWRNSFERRTGRLRIGEGNYLQIHHLPLDVGVPHGQAGTPLHVTVSGPFTVNRSMPANNATTDNYNPPSTTLGMVYGTARSGNSAFRLAGTRDAGESALYRYRIANTRIKIESGMCLSYWINATGLGENVMVDLLLDDGAHVSVSATAQDTGSPQGGWQQRTLTIPDSLIDRYITAVIVAYMDSESATGTNGFAALIDDIVIDK